MRVPISWLAEFVDLPSEVEAVADRLAMLGFPVAEIVRRPVITGVVVGRIATLEKHPNADRLQVAQIDVAGPSKLTVATAATNVAAGQTIAVATIGARLPELTIAPRTMRGVASQGMMISAEELALPGEWFEDGIMQLDPSLPLGANVVDLFGLETAVLDVEVTSNRPDAMSVIGLARELAAFYGVPLRLPPQGNPGTRAEPAGETPEVTIESSDCHRFVAQRFDGLSVGPAPAWMRVRLALAGQRPINNLVDVSNYVMLETGQPLHFYDAAQVRGNHLIVRDARAGESFVTLDDVTRSLDSRALVIADPDRALCLAGLMGGTLAEVGASTTAIILEAANFNGARVRRMSAALALRTEASSRHEKSLAPALTDLGAARAATLLGELGATVYRPHAFGAGLEAPATIRLRASEVEQLLGLPISPERIAAHLTALGAGVETAADGSFSVTPPVWRRDLSVPADLVEEVARIEGYDRIPAVLPSIPPHEISSQAYQLENALAGALAGLGYREVLTHSLRSEGAVQVRNPLSEEQRFLRDSLIPGLVEYLARSQAPARIFEIGDVFTEGADAIVERALLAFAFSADRNDEPAWHDSRFLQLKGDCEQLLRDVTGVALAVARATPPGFHPGKTAQLLIDGRQVGYAGAIDPRVGKAFDSKRDVYACVLDLGALPAYRTPHYQPPSRFPSTYRDLALVVDAGLEAETLERAIRETLGPICIAARAFDEYRGQQIGEERKSLAIRVTLQSYEATITDEEADAAVSALLVRLHERFGATIRT